MKPTISMARVRGDDMGEVDQEEDMDDEDAWVDKDDENDDCFEMSMDVCH